MTTQTDNTTRDDTRIVFTTPPKLPPVVPALQPEQSSSPSGRVGILRWIARIVGLLGAVLLGIVLNGDAVGGSAPLGRPVTWAISLFVVLAVLLASISDLGGALVVIGAVASLVYALANATIGVLIPSLVLLALAGLLFIYCGWRARLPSRDAA